MVEEDDYYGTAISQLVAQEQAEVNRYLMDILMNPWPRPPTKLTRRERLSAQLTEARRRLSDAWYVLRYGGYVE